MSKKSGPNKKNLDQTHRLFIRKAKAEFVKYGYADASTNRIVDASGMARGSLYYHFDDKKGLFAEVYKSLLIEMSTQIEKEMAKQPSKWDALKAGCALYIDLCLKKERRRLILESYTALDYMERLTIQRQTLLSMLEDLLRDLMKDGYFKGQDPFVMTILIYGMIAEAGRSFELAKDPKTIHEPIVNGAMAMLEKMAH